MMKITKTQAQLLHRARCYGGRATVETSAGRGPRGGRLFYGARERDALFALEKMGMVEIVAREPWTDYNRGYGSSGNVFAYRLTAQA